MRKELKKHYNPTIDLLRVIAILAVVLIHTSTKTLEVNKLDVVTLPWSLYLNQASRFAVPLFFFISGFVLELNYSFHTSYLSFLKKRLNKLLIPYLFWSSIYFLFVYVDTRYGIFSREFFHKLLLGDASYQLYFIPTLILFYLAFPVLHTYYRYFANKWALSALFVLQWILLYRDYFIHTIDLDPPLRIALLNFFIFPLGMVVSHHQKSIIEFLNKWKQVVVALAVAGSFIITAQAFYWYTRTHRSGYIYNQWHPITLLYTLAFSAAMTFVNVRKEQLLKTIQTLANLSLFVYFVHVIVLEIVWGNIGMRLNEYTNGWITKQIWYDPLFFITVAGISFAAAAGVHSIPRLRSVTG